jgi:hypothetical protein
MIGDNKVYEPGFSLLPGRGDKEVKVDTKAVFEDPMINRLNHSKLNLSEYHDDKRDFRQV